MLKIKKIVAIFFVFFLIFFQGQILAFDLNLPSISVGPDKYVLFSAKRLFEKAIIFTKFSKKTKADFYKDLTLTRMAELKYVVEHKLIGEVEKSTQRLSFQVGILSDYTKENKIELANKIPAIQELLSSYKTPLETLRDKYPANSSYWMLVQHSINSINLNLDKLK